MSKEKFIHISIDDCQSILGELIENDYDTLWQARKLWLLKRLHSLFGAKFTLYVFNQIGTYTLNDVPDKYRKEWEGASDWLKFGFHAVSEAQQPTNILPDFKDTYAVFKSNIERFAGTKSLAKILRLHYWFYPEEYVKVLRREGVKTILVKEGQIVNVAGLETWVTNVRIEKEKMGTILTKIVHHAKQYPLVIFTHEWALNRITKLKLSLTIFVVKMMGYKFICD